MRKMKKIKSNYKFKKQLDIGEFQMFTLNTEEFLLPQGMLILPMTTKRDFLIWAVKGALYMTDKPDEEGFYTFYALCENMGATYKQQGDEL